MRFRWQYVWILIGVIIAIGCDDDRDVLSQSSKAVDQTVGSLDKQWAALNAKAEKFDPQSSLTDLDQQKDKVTRQIGDLKQKAGNEYDVLQAQYKRLDAAERLKKAQQEIDQLKQTGKSLEDTADKASQGLDRAKKAYQSASDEYAKIKSQAAGSGVTLP